MSAVPPPTGASPITSAALVSKSMPAIRSGSAAGQAELDRDTRLTVDAAGHDDLQLVGAIGPGGESLAGTEDGDGGEDGEDESAQAWGTSGSGLRVGR